jgi:hypothetical protein
LTEPKQRTQLELIDQRLREIRLEKDSAKRGAAIDRHLKLRQKELDRLAALGIDAEKEIRREKLSTPPKDSDVRLTDAPAGTLDDFILKPGNEVKAVPAQTEPEIAEEPEELALPESTREMTVAEAQDFALEGKTPEQVTAIWEMRRRNVYQIQNADGKSSGTAFTYACRQATNYDATDVIFVESRTDVKHLALIDVLTGRWVGMNGKPLPSLAEVARRTRIRDEHLQKLDREERQRQAETPAPKWQVRKAFDVRKYAGLPPRIFDGTSSFNRDEEAALERRNQESANRESISSNPWLAN